MNARKVLLNYLQNLPDAGVKPQPVENNNVEDVPRICASGAWSVTCKAAQHVKSHVEIL